MSALAGILDQSRKKLLVLQMLARHVLEAVWLGSQALAIRLLMFSGLDYSPDSPIEGSDAEHGAKHTQDSHTRVTSARHNLSSYLATKNKILRKVDTSCLLTVLFIVK